MFLKNLWYCAAWDYEVTQGNASLAQRKITGTLRVGPAGEAQRIMCALPGYRM